MDAIKDENVLRFSVEYVGKYKQKADASNLDIEVDAIDEKGMMESPIRLEKIAQYIMDHHQQKTKHPDFTAMFCVSNVATLVKYYDLFKEKQAGAVKPLRIATIFSYAANEESPLANGLIPEEAVDVPSAVQIDQSSRDKLDSFIADYNAMFGTQYGTQDSQSFYAYYQDIAKRVRAGEVDILLVVNMFLTGFDSPRLNTMYVDKSLRHHGLIQAFSRTNRILNERKSQGNIICFRNLKKATDEAIALFSNKDAKETVLLEPYDDYILKFNIAANDLLTMTPTPQSVDDLPDEKAELAFVTKFRELLRLKNVLTVFSEFKDDDLGLPSQQFEDYKSKYLDLYEKSKRPGEGGKPSVLDDVDFELTLIHRDEINVAYILNLLLGLSKLKPEDAKKRQKEILDMIAADAHLRSKRELIKRFIDDNLPHIKPDGDVLATFTKFWSEQQTKAFNQLCTDEQIGPAELQKLVSTYTFANRMPRDQEIKESLSYKPKIGERKSILKRVAEKIRDFIDTFIEGMGGVV